MSLLLISLGLLTASSLVSFLVRKGVRHFGCGGAFVGSAVGLFFSIHALVQHTSGVENFGTSLPDLNIAFGMDSLSAFFLTAIFGLSLLASLYAWGYVKDQRLLHHSLPFLPLLAASMAAVVVARDGFLFLICWEVMSLASFFLVVAEHEIREVRHAGWIYLIATHLATAFLTGFFVVLYQKTGSFHFNDWIHIVSLSPVLAGTLFLFALIGFGTKAGIFPFHIWLPHAHPAAPSYISAIMSGVMIKTGIYGLLRALTFLGPPPLWWGTALVGLGLLSVLSGILYATVQGNLKKFLAYSSVENIGIIITGIGLGLIGVHKEETLLIVLGFGGGLLHIWNHAIFKGLLFMGAGSVLHATGTQAIEQLGGLIKKMPVTGWSFLVGAAAICGLPPLNGFISEFLISIGLFRGAQTLTGVPLFFVVAGIVGIAFAGGLALACFAKVFGIVFLGEPRSNRGKTAHESPLPMRIPLIILAALCFLGGISPVLVWPILMRVITVMAPSPEIALNDISSNLLTPVVWVFLLLLALGLMGGWISQLLQRGKLVRCALTWDCGYTRPSSRMQYTASSFAQPIAVFFRVLFKPHLQFKKPNGIFPGPANFAVYIIDFAERLFFRPLFKRCDTVFFWVRSIQRGTIQGQLALIFFTLIGLLLWGVWFGI